MQFLYQKVSKRQQIVAIKPQREQNRRKRQITEGSKEAGQSVTQLSLSGLYAAQ